MTQEEFKKKIKEVFDALEENRALPRNLHINHLNWRSRLLGYFFPSWTLNSLGECIQTATDGLQELCALAANRYCKQLNANHIENGFSKYVPELVDALSAHFVTQYSADTAIAKDCESKLEGLVAKLSNIKKIIKNSDIKQTQKQLYINAIKYSQGFIYNALLISYRKSNKFNLMILACQKTDEGYKNMPRNVTGHAVLTDGSNEVIAQNVDREYFVNHHETNTLDVFINYFIHKDDYKTALTYMAKIVKAKVLTDCTFDDFFAPLYGKLKNNNQNKEILQFSEALIAYYTAVKKFNVSSGGNALNGGSVIKTSEEKIKYYSDLHNRHKAEHIENIKKAETYSFENFAIDFSENNDIQVVSAHTTFIDKILSQHPVSGRTLNKIDDQRYNLLNWYDYSPEKLQQHLMKLDKTLSESLDNTHSDSSESSSSLSTTRIRHESLGHQNNYDDQGSSSSSRKSASVKSIPKGQKGKLPAEQPLNHLLNRLDEKFLPNEPHRAADIGFESIDADTIVYDVSGNRVLKGLYYIYEGDMNELITDPPLLKRFKNLIQAGEVVPPGKPGIRLLSQNEMDKHNDCFMKLAIPGGINPRIGIKEEETIEKDGRAITLCRPTMIWKH